MFNYLSPATPSLQFNILPLFQAIEQWGQCRNGERLRMMNEWCQLPKQEGKGSNNTVTVVLGDFGAKAVWQFRNPVD